MYRLAPVEGYISQEEGERRLKARLRRLVEVYGQEAVLRRIRLWPAASAEDETRKAWLVLTVYAVERRGAGTV